jgi:hypothetical protein
MSSQTGTADMAITATYRGSRKHVLDWVSCPTFLTELLDLVRGVEVRVTRDSRWMPLGYQEPAEARLEEFGPGWNRLSPAWEDLQRWWLAHPKGANTPNWDIALGCEIGSQPALLLVEAKAHEAELSSQGKTAPNPQSDKSKANHEQIARAIDLARAGWSAAGHELQISRDTHYQLSNRLAFLWKLAQADIPTVLVYLGFTGDDEFMPGLVPFRDHQHWVDTFTAHAQAVMPRTIIENCLHLGPAPTWLLVRSRPVLELSRRGP